MTTAANLTDQQFRAHLCRDVALSTCAPGRREQRWAARGHALGHSVHPARCWAGQGLSESSSIPLPPVSGAPMWRNKKSGQVPGRFPGKSQQSPAPADIFKGLFQPKRERGFLPHVSEESGGQRRARHVSSPRPAACHQILLQPQSPELPEGGRRGCTHKGGEGPPPRPAPSVPQDWGPGHPTPAPSAPPGLGALSARAQHVSPEQLASHPRTGALGPWPRRVPQDAAGQHSPVPPADLVTPLSHGVSPGVSLW